MLSPVQILAIKGVTFCACLLIFIIANLMVVYCMNRERDRESFFWMGISLVSGILAVHLSQFFV